MSVSLHANKTDCLNCILLFRTEQIIFLYVLLFVIILGNVIVILSLGCIRRRKSRMNFFILHLAVAGKLLFLLLIKK